MLTELCSEVNNWFDRNQPKFSGRFSISGGVISGAESMGLQIGQYYRIIDSVFNDGVHKYTGQPDEGLTNETFSGSVWLMAVPKEFISLSDEIDAWQTKYKDVTSSPLASESLSPTSYSYSLNTSAGGGTGATWQNIFASRLTKWRKMRP